MSAAAHIFPVEALVDTTWPLIPKKLLQTFLEVFHYPLKKFGNNQALANMNFKIWCYIKLTQITLMKCADDFYANSCEGADVYDKSTFKDIYVELVDISLYFSVQNVWAMHPQEDVTNIPFNAKTLLAIQKQAIKSVNTNNQAASNKQYRKRTWNKPSAHKL